MGKTKKKALMVPIFGNRITELYRVISRNIILSPQPSLHSPEKCNLSKVKYEMNNRDKMWPLKSGVEHLGMG